MSIRGGGGVAPSSDSGARGAVTTAFGPVDWGMGRRVGFPFFFFFQAPKHSAWSKRTHVETLPAVALAPVQVHTKGHAARHPLLTRIHGAYTHKPKCSVPRVIPPTRPHAREPSTAATGRLDGWGRGPTNPQGAPPPPPRPAPRAASTPKPARVGGHPRGAARQIQLQELEEAVVEQRPPPPVQVPCNPKAHLVQHL